MKTLFWVVMLLFSIVTTKIVHYSSMAYFPVSFLAAKFLHDWLTNKVLWNKWLSFGVVSLGFVLSLVLAAVPYVGQHTEKIIPLIKDRFVAKNLEAPVEWHGAEILIGILYFFSILVVVGVFARSKKTNHKWLFISTLSISTAICLLTFGAVVVPKIERYTQGAAIDFYESKRGQNVYIHVLGFKSYAHLFYFQKPASVLSNQNSAMYEDWLLNGKVDKPVFFVTKIDRINDYKYHPNLEVMKEENGFVFLRRKVIF